MGKRKWRKNQLGFSAIEGLLVVLVVAVIGFGGYYVWHTQRQNSTKDSASTQPTSIPTKTTSTTAPVKPTDPTANWTSYTSKDGKFSLKYPHSWVLPADSSDCPNSQFYTGPSASSAGSCNSNDTGSTPEITVLDTNHPCGALSDNATTQAVSISGANGQKYMGASSGSTVDTNLIGPAGTKYVEYCITPSVGSSLEYEATYIQRPTYPDVSSDFNIMVTKTLTFN